jgi:hypothetical protein
MPGKHVSQPTANRTPFLRFQGCEIPAKSEQTMTKPIFNPGTHEWYRHAEAGSP